MKDYRFLLNKLPADLRQQLQSKIDNTNAVIDNRANLFKKELTAELNDLPTQRIKEKYLESSLNDLRRFIADHKLRHIVKSRSTLFYDILIAVHNNHDIDQNYIDQSVHLIANIEYFQWIKSEYFPQQTAKPEPTKFEDIMLTESQREKAKLFAQLQNVTPPIVDKNFNYLHGDFKGPIVAWINFLLENGKLSKEPKKLIANLLNKKIANLDISDRTFYGPYSNLYYEYSGQFTMK